MRTSKSIDCRVFARAARFAEIELRVIETDNVELVPIFAQERGAQSSARTDDDYAHSDWLIESALRKPAHPIKRLGLTRAARVHDLRRSGCGRREISDTRNALP